MLGVQGTQRLSWDHLEAELGQLEVSYSRRKRSIASCTMPQCRGENAAMNSLFANISTAWLKKKFVSSPRYYHEPACAG